MGSGRLPLRHTRRGPASRVSLPPRWLSRLAGRLCGRRFSIARAVDEEAGGRVFGLHVDGQQHFGVKSLFGLSTRYFSCDLEFARVEVCGCAPETLKGNTLPYALAHSTRSPAASAALDHGNARNRRDGSA
eukprot:6187242-Pleurochrysis_carterae.AAC.1